MLFSALLLGLAVCALPIPHRDALAHAHHKRDLPAAAPHTPNLAKRHIEVPVPQGGSFHNETHWWVPDTVHHGLVEADRQAGDNTDIGGRRVQMHIVQGRARTSWA